MREREFSELEYLEQVRPYIETSLNVADEIARQTGASPERVQIVLSEYRIVRALQRLQFAGN